MTILGTTQKSLSWTGCCLIKHLHKMTTKQIRLFLADCSFLFPP